MIFAVWDHSRTHLTGSGDSIESAFEDAKRRHPKYSNDKEHCSVWAGEYPGLVCREHFITHDLSDLNKGGECVFRGAKVEWALIKRIVEAEQEKAIMGSDANVLPPMTSTLFRQIRNAADQTMISAERKAGWLDSQHHRWQDLTEFGKSLTEEEGKQYDLDYRAGYADGHSGKPKAQSSLGYENGYQVGAGHRNGLVAQPG